MPQTQYTKMAECTVESLWDSRLDLDRYLQELKAAVQGRIQDIQTSPDDYTAEELNYAEEMERDCQLKLDRTDAALSQLRCALGQVLPSDERIIVGHIKTAATILQEQKRNSEWKR